MSGETAPAQDFPSRFDLYRDGLLHEWLRQLTTLGYSLVPIFFLLDTFVMPRALLERFALYRGACTLLLLGQHFVVRRTKPSRYSFLHGYVTSLLVALTVTQMTVDLGGFNSGYYAGLNLVIVAVNLLLPWGALHSAINGVLVMGIYVVANVVLGGDYEKNALINNLYFMGGTVLITIALTLVRSKQIEEEFKLREALLALNDSLETSRVELKAARDRLWAEMELAVRIQTALLPANRTLGHAEVVATMTPAAEVGGDYYDFLETPHGERWLAVGDVSGHGVESGLVMMMAQTTLLTLVKDQPGRAPSQVFESLNHTLRDNIARLRNGRYMTINVVRIDDNAMVVSGKHQDVLVWRRARGAVEVIENDGLWLGVIDDVKGRVDDLTIPMATGDIALFFTDGVTEAANARGEMYGQDRLVRSFQDVVTMLPGQAVKELQRRVTDWQPVPDDDVTLVLVRWK